MKKTLILTIAGLALGNLPSQALQIVYPKQVNTQVSANSTFFVGNTTPDSVLTINSKLVKVYENGSFVEVVPLIEGDNTIKIESKKDTQCDTVTYVIKKVPKSDLIVPEPQTEIFKDNEYIYATIVKDNTPLRAEPNENGKRLTHLNHDTILMLNGKKGDYYRVALNNSTEAWVKAENIVNYSTINGKMLATASSITTSDDKLYDYIKTSISFPVPYKITETDNGLTLEVYNIKENPADRKTFKTSSNIKTLAVNTTSVDNVSTYFVELSGKLWGYEAYYEQNNLVLKIRKAPQIDVQNPLKEIIIAIDPGHGGDDAGAIGPTGIKEKEINLDTAIRLQKSLEKVGATVVMTRNSDSSTGLYERPQIAKKGDALIMISLHANALADGADPYIKHGTSTYYYNNEAKELAKTIKENLIKDLGTKDDGLCKCSFVLTRPTMPLSVLVEIAYMIHPDEYTLLLDENFRQKTADSIQKSLGNYILNSVTANPVSK